MAEPSALQMLIEPPPHSTSPAKHATSNKQKDQSEDNFFLEPSLGVTGGYNLPTVDQIFQQQHINHFDLFNGGNINDAFVLGESDSQDLFPSAVAHESLCTNLDMLGFVSPSAIDNFNNQEEHNEVKSTKSGISTSSSDAQEKRTKKRRGSSPATFKPPSPRGRPKSIYRPGEKPAPPNLYNVLTSPKLQSPVLLNIHSPNMQTPLSPSMNYYYNPTQGQPSIMPAPQWIYAPAPPLPGTAAAYYGYARPPLGQTVTSKVPMVPLNRTRAQSEPETILGTPLTFAQKRQEQQQQLQQQQQSSPTSSLDSQLETVMSEDLSAAQSFMQNVQLAKEQFMAATKSLDYTNVTVHEMKAILRKFGLMTTGKKADLINRIQLTRKCLLEANP